MRIRQWIPSNRRRIRWSISWGAWCDTLDHNQQDNIKLGTESLVEEGSHKSSWRFHKYGIMIHLKLTDFLRPLSSSTFFCASIRRRHHHFPSQSAKLYPPCFVCVYSSLIVYSDEMKREDFYVHPLFECEFERLKNIEFEISGRLFGLYLAAHLISVDPSRSCRMLIPLPPPPCHCQPEICLYMCEHLAIFGTFVLIYCITLQHSAHRQRHHPRVE